MLLNISSSPTSYFPRRSKTHLPKSHIFPNLSALSNQSFKNRVLFGNKMYPDGKRIDFRTRAISGIDLGSFKSVLEATDVLTAIIIVHEAGNFLAASLQGIQLSKFAIGFGPILSKFDFNNVEYSLRAFPLCGFVGFPDNDPDIEIPIDDKSLLKNIPTLDRSIVVSAGIIANVIFAFVQELFLVFLFLKLKPFLLLLTKVRPRNIPETFRFAGKEFMGLSSTVLDGLKQTFFNFSQTASQVAGHVAIIAVGAEVARSNIDELYQFAALLNINLSVINLLSLPALDGGTLALILLEAVRGGRKLPAEMEQGIISSGIMLVLFLGFILIVKDTLSLDFIKTML